jgi:di/tricarboxylate transporter
MRDLARCRGCSHARNRGRGCLLRIRYARGRRSRTRQDVIMTPEIALILVILVVTVIMLATEMIPVDVTALLVLLALVAAGLLEPAKVLAGFVDDIILILACIFVIGGTLARSGLTYRFATLLLGIAQRHHALAPLLMTIAAALSAFFSNTSATALLMPTTLEVARKARIQPGKLLMPLAFASILGGTCTLIGTSTNLASAGLISRLGMEPYSLFEFIVPGLLLMIIGIVYMSVIGYRLIPDRAADNVIDDYPLHDYLSELLIDAESPAVDATIGSLRLDSVGITPLALVRKRRKRTAHGNRKLKAGDKIIVKGSRDALLRARDSRKFSIEAERTLTDRELGRNRGAIDEVILMPGSHMLGKSLKDLRFYDAHEIAVLAVHRRGHTYAAQIENMVLRAGDVLLVQGAKQQLKQLASDPDVWMLATQREMPLSTRDGVFALIAMLGAIVISLTGWLPLSMAFLLGVVALVLTGCTTTEEAYASIEWRLLVLIACMAGLGIAIQDSGCADYLASIAADFGSRFGVRATLAALAVLTIALTQPMSNAAAALVVIPVAVATAGMLGADPRPFAVMVTLSASLSFITPLEPASLLVFGIGKYRFRDFIVVGVPLTTVVLAVLIFLVPVLWPV